MDNLKRDDWDSQAKNCWKQKEERKNTFKRNKDLRRDSTCAAALLALVFQAWTTDDCL
jgi:hypothetical protein